MEFQLRPFVTADVPSLVKYGNNKKIFDNLTDAFPYPYTEEKAQQFIAMANSHHPPHILAIEINGEICGALGLHAQTDVHRMNMELGYWLAEPYWGKGIMSKAIPRMVAYGFANWDISRIFARPYGRNIASQKALEKAGFILEAKLEKTLFKNGNAEDEFIYAVRKSGV